MDVETAFPNGKLDEEIYMQQPEGYVKPGEEHLVCNLEKSLYGLEQSSRRWNKVFRESIEKIGFIQASADSCVFIRKDALTIIGVHVDDLMILPRKITEMRIRSDKDSLKLQFKIKDMGALHYYVGVNVKLQKEDGFSRPVDVTSYQSIVGSLLYAVIAIATRPDSGSCVEVLCQSHTKSFNSNKANPQISESNCISRIEIQMLMEISLVIQIQIGRVIWMTGFPLQETCSHWLVG